MRELPPELLRSFVAVAQTKSFTAASERVYLSQSAVSQHIRRLEVLLGQTLFERHTRKVSMTSHGEALYRYASRILQLMDEAVTVVSESLLNGRIRLGISEDFTLTHLTSALAGFARYHPGVELSISTGMSGDLFYELDSERHDIVFAKRLTGSRRGRVVRTERLYWCAGPHITINGSGAVLPLALHPEPSVSRTRILEILKAINCPYKITTVSSSVTALRAAVVAGLGVSAFARYAMPGTLIRLDTGLPDLGKLEYVIDRPNEVSPAVIALESVLMAAAKIL